MFALMSSACLITVIIAAFACSGVFSLIGITATSFHIGAYVSLLRSNINYFGKNVLLVLALVSVSVLVLVLVSAGELSEK